MKSIIHACSISFGLCLIAALVACGGGGGSGAAPSPAPTVDAAQGIWESAAGAAMASSAVVLPDGSVWLAMVDNNGTRTQLIKASLVVNGSSFSGGGSNFTTLSATGQQSSTSSTLSLSVVPKSTMNGSVTTGAVVDTLSLAYAARYDIAENLSDYTGKWSGSAGTGTVSLSLTVVGSADVTGSSSTGCTYSGKLSSRSEAKAVSQLTLFENCAGVVRSFAGISLLNANKMGATWAAVTSDNSGYLLVHLSK